VTRVGGPSPGWREMSDDAPVEVTGRRVAVLLACVGVGLGSGCTADRPEDAAQGSPTSPSASAVRPSPTPTPVPPLEAAWLPAPWVLESTTRSSPISAAAPEYLLCGWRVPPSRVVSGDRTALSDQVLRHPGGLSARLLRYETDVPGGLVNLFKLAYSSCLDSAQARSVAGPRNVWVHEGRAGGSDFGVGGVIGDADPSGSRGGAPFGDAQVLHVVEVSSSDTSRRMTHVDAADVLDAWADTS
jgi:hypothetical protein